MSEKHKLVFNILNGFVRRNPYYSLWLCTRLLGAIYGAIVNRIENRSILELNFTKKDLQPQYHESDAPDDDLFGFFQRATFYRLIESPLRAAADDLRLRGVLVRVTQSPLPFSLTQMETIYDILMDMKVKGKSVVVYLHDASSGVAATYQALVLCAAADYVVAPRYGFFSFIGISIVSPFLNKLVEEKMSSEAQFEARRRYKTAANMFLERSYTKEHREQVETLATSYESILVSWVMQSKRMKERIGDEEAVLKLFDEAPFSSAQAVARGFIDEVASEGELYSRILAEQMDGEAGKGGAVEMERRLVSLQFYRQRLRQQRGARVERKFIQQSSSPLASLRRLIPIKSIRPHRIAFIAMEGNIVDGISNASTIGDDSVIEQLQEARRDSSIDGVILRINSRGGSARASERINEEILLLKEAQKPVVASLATVAASGGYYIACNASKIVVHRCTLTGSIGVVSGKFNFRGFLDQRLGVTVDNYDAHENSNLFNLTSSFSDAQRRKLSEVFVDPIYESFKEQVSNGRRLTMERVEELAQGQVYVGDDAAAVGLVDSIGGIDVALEEMARLLPLGPTKDCLDVVYYPQRSVLSLLVKYFTRQRRRNSRKAGELSMSLSLQRCLTVLGVHLLESMAPQLTQSLCQWMLKTTFGAPTSELLQLYASSSSSSSNCNVLLIEDLQLI